MMAGAREPELSNHNQPPPLQDYNLFSSDRALTEAVVREGAQGTTADLEAYGARLGARETLALGEAANRAAPVLHAFDRYGERIDLVEFHPAWHALMEIQVEEGIHCSPWSDPSPGAQVRRAARLYMSGQVEAGTSCPISMTFAAAPVLSRSPTLAGAWLPRLLSRRYDPAHAPAETKAGTLVGMGMTERQGGSDLSETETTAAPAADGAWRVDGAKWFFSAPMCDAFLVLARAPGGLACFFMPRWRRDGRLNGIRLQRLKD
ncbi:MAG: acyl-CoA dehydrogenase family protein, partial [Caulobacteraceae bacterium]